MTVPPDDNIRKKKKKTKKKKENHARERGRGEGRGGPGTKRGPGETHMVRDDDFRPADE